MGSATRNPLRQPARAARKAHQDALRELIQEARKAPCSVPGCGARQVALRHRPGAQVRFSIGDALRLLPGVEVLREEIGRCEPRCKDHVRGDR